MTDLKKMAEQLGLLIEEYSTMSRPLPKEKVRILKNRLESAIERASLPGSTYATQLEQVRKQTASDGWRLEAIHGIAVGLRDDIQAGWTESVVELVHADMHSDYLEMAETLLEAGYKDPAAVITGTTLEVHVRVLCVKYGVGTELPNGTPKKADTMNADLKKAGVYDGLQQKQITAWMDLRNKAAHGDYAEYDKAQVRLFIEGVRAFMVKYPA
ncbi:hypothetical protein [Streptomyces sp. NBC_01439]|uniref:hypothetical protein n=1 Tax=Streptomyces sp. NBC_01439 TaxID=2903867 RepID=UPI002E2873C3|nr:hypothetical protein [Streptomyces sp. NBC_01439]